MWFNWTFYIYLYYIKQLNGGSRLHHFLTILQSGHRLCLYAEDTVSYVVGGQHSKLV